MVEKKVLAVTVTWRRSRKDTTLSRPETERVGSLFLRGRRKTVHPLGESVLLVPGERGAMTVWGRHVSLRAPRH